MPARGSRPPVSSMHLGKVQCGAGYHDYHLLIVTLCHSITSLQCSTGDKMGSTLDCQHTAVNCTTEPLSAVSCRAQSLQAETLPPMPHMLSCNPLPPPCRPTLYPATHPRRLCSPAPPAAPLDRTSAPPLAATSAECPVQCLHNKHVKKEAGSGCSGLLQGRHGTGCHQQEKPRARLAPVRAAATKALSFTGAPRSQCHHDGDDDDTQVAKHPPHLTRQVVKLQCRWPAHWRG